MAIGLADLFVKSRENAAGILWKILSVFLSFFLLWMLSPFRTMAVCWLALQCSMISYLAAGAFFSNFWCLLNFRAVVFFGSCRLNVCGSESRWGWRASLGRCQIQFCMRGQTHSVRVCVRSGGLYKTDGGRDWSCCQPLYTSHSSHVRLLRRIFTTFLLSHVHFFFYFFSAINLR